MAEVSAEGLHRLSPEGGVLFPHARAAVDWSRQPYARLQALPAGGRPLREWSSRERAWADVARGIRRALEELRAGSSS